MQEHYLDEWKKSMDETIKEIRRDLYIGNGRPGLTYRMASAETDIQSLKEKEERRAKKQDRIEVGVWLAFVASVIGMILQHLK